MPQPKSTWDLKSGCFWSEISKVLRLLESTVYKWSPTIVNLAVEPPIPVPDEFSEKAERPSLDVSHDKMLNINNI